MPYIDSIYLKSRNFLVLTGILLITACGGSAIDSAQVTPVEVVTQDCEQDAGIRYICGPVNAEDILQLGASEWLLASGMNGDLLGNSAINGKLHLINSVDKSWEVIFPAAQMKMVHNSELYPNCPDVLDVSNFSVHGLALQNYPEGSELYRLYITSHGAREAIEVFEIDASAKPTITWTGCVPMPVTSWTNSVAILEDGGFVATQFMNPTGPGIEAVRAGEITGHVFSWHPGQEVKAISGTELSGANGIVASEDGNFIYVAGFGNQYIARYDLRVSPPLKTVATLPIEPDNVRWTEKGTLITAGANVAEKCEEDTCRGGWSVWEIDPDSLLAQSILEINAGNTFGVPSSALIVGDEIWIGTYAGEKIAIVSLPK